MARTIFFCCLSLFFVTLARAEGPDRQQVVQRLKQMRGKIEREEGTLKDLKRRQGEFQTSLETMAGDLKLIDEKQNVLRTRVEELETKQSSLETNLSQGEVDLERQKGVMRVRTVAVYKMYRRTVGLDYVVGSGSVNDLLRRARYLAVVARRDKERFTTLSESVQNMQREKSELGDTKTILAQQMDLLVKLEADLERKKIQQAELLDKSKQEAAEEEKVLGKLNKAADDLESTLSRLMGNTEELPTPDSTSEPGETPTPEPSYPEPQVAEVTPAPFEGDGLAKMKGQLKLPVSGTIVQGFGEARIDDFNDKLFRKGLEFSATLGSRANAVASGRVVYSGVLPAYGNVVIVDHGARFYTLYGRLASSLVKVGETVKKGDALAVLGEPDRKGRNFYFELRVKGKAVDPKTYF